MCSTQDRQKIINDFKNRPAYMSAASFARNVGVHWTTIYGWMREDKARVERSQPARSDGYKAVASQLKSCELRREFALSEAEKMLALADNLQCEAGKLKQALDLLA